VLLEIARVTSPYLEPRWRVEGRSLRSWPNLRLTSPPSRHSATSQQFGTHGASIGLLIKPIAEHFLSQDYLYKVQCLPRMNHRQLGIPRQLSFIRDLNTSSIGEGLCPQATNGRPGMPPWHTQDFLFLHSLQLSSIWAGSKGMCRAFPTLLPYNPSLNSAPVCPTGLLS